jgi:2-(3-amino-3-carboxypropyl)histidine synthase
MYSLELEKAAKRIKDSGANLVCIQLADGLKPKAKDIADYLEQNTKAKIIIWMSSCFGACDIPAHIEKLGFDLLIQFGHVKIQGLDFEHARKFPAIEKQKQAKLAMNRKHDGKFRHSGWKNA